MTDFIPVLVAGVLSLLVLFALFGGFIAPAGEEQEPARRNVAYVSNDINIGSDFSVADMAKSYKITSMKANVSSGLVSGSQKSVSFDVDKFSEIDYGKIYLDVKDANLYGSLIIIVNDNIVYAEGTPVGEHVISFNKTYLNATDNVLTVKAEGSGWRIWAPNVYDFDLSLYGDMAEDSEKVTVFTLPYDPTYAKLSIYVSDKEGTGYLRVTVNDYLVYRGRSSGFKTFDAEVLREGNNRAVVSAEPGSSFDIQTAYITFE